MKYLIIFVSLLLILILSFNLRTILTNKELFYQTPPTTAAPTTATPTTAAPTTAAPTTAAPTTAAPTTAAPTTAAPTTAAVDATTPGEQLGCNNEQHSNIIADKNIFFDKDNVTINNINCDKLCIVEDNDNVECITKAELFNAINLPAFRKHSICIGDACITNNVINKVNGKERINLKSNYKLNPKFKNKCLNQTTDTATTCSRQKFRWETGTYTGWGSSGPTSCSYAMPNNWNTKGTSSDACRGGGPARVEWRRERRWIKDMNSYSSQYNLVDKSNYNMELLKSDNCDKTNKNNKFSIHMGLPVSSIETELKKSEFNYVPKKVAHNQHINRQNT